MPAPPTGPSSHPRAGWWLWTLCPSGVPGPMLTAVPQGGRGGGEETGQVHTQTLRGKSSRPTCAHAPLALHQVSPGVSEPLNPPSVPAPSRAASQTRAAGKRVGAESLLSSGPHAARSSLRPMPPVHCHTLHGAADSERDPEVAGRAAAQSTKHAHHLAFPRPPSRTRVDLASCPPGHIIS